MKDPIITILSLLIPLIAIAMGLFYYFANKRQHAKAQKNTRITNVVRLYVHNASNRKVSGIQGLCLAGINNLLSDEEIRDAYTQISHQIGKRPLGRYEDVINEISHTEFFKRACENNNFKKYEPEKLVERIKKGDFY